jgi:O-antigen/teichoic acid export membrane protein
MGYVDRFMIAALLSAGAVAYYATPHELATKLRIVPGALAAVLFPTFASRIVATAEHVTPLFDKAVLWLFAALLPVCVALTLFAKELLGAWIGPEFALQSAPLLRVFAVGMLINGLAHVPFTLMQSAGAARITALIHVLELPFFLGCLWVLTRSFGVEGAAFTWLLRIVLETALLFVLSAPLIGRTPSYLFNRKAVALASLAALGFCGALIAPLSLRILWVFCVTALLVPVVLGSRILRRRSGDLVRRSVSSSISGVP